MSFKFLYFSPCGIILLLKHVTNSHTTLSALQGGGICPGISFHRYKEIVLESSLVDPSYEYVIKDAYNQSFNMKDITLIPLSDLEVCVHLAM